MYEDDQFVPAENTLTKAIHEHSDRSMDSSALVNLAKRIAVSLELGVAELRRLVDQVCPPPDAVVDTQYVATKLGVTIERISQLVRDQDIPSHCVVEGSGNGKPWKFHRRPIEAWIRNR